MKKNIIYLFIYLIIYNSSNAQNKDREECGTMRLHETHMKDPKYVKKWVKSSWISSEKSAKDFTFSTKTKYSFKQLKFKDTVCFNYSFDEYLNRDNLNSAIRHRQMNYGLDLKYVSYQNLLNLNEKKENDKELQAITNTIIIKEKDSVGIVLKVYVVGYNTDTSWNEEQFKKMIAETQAVADKMIAYGLDKNLIQIIPYWIKPLVGYTDDRKKQIGIYILGN